MDCNGQWYKLETSKNDDLLEECRFIFKSHNVEESGIIIKHEGMNINSRFTKMKDVRVGLNPSCDVVRMLSLLDKSSNSKAREGCFSLCFSFNEVACFTPLKHFIFSKVELKVTYFTSWIFKDYLSKEQCGKFKEKGYNEENFLTFENFVKNWDKFCRYQGFLPKK